MDMFGRDSSGGQSSGELRLILVGNIGCGKTLTADTLLNDSSSLSALMPSRLSEVRRGLSEGRHLRVVETPRWYWKGEHIDVGVQKETEKALSLVAPGPHAFLILVPVGQFTEMETRIPAELERAFGRGALEHALVLLTCGDYLAGRDHDRYISVGEPGLSTMVNDCGGRWHVINNRRPEDRKQVISLLEKVERLTKVSGGCYLPSPMQRQVEEGIHEKERELIRSYSLREEELVSPEHSALSHTAWSKEETWDDSGRRKIRVRSMGPATGRVMSQQLANGLHSQTSYDDTELKQKSSSFKLSKEGAILSQMSETEQAAKNQTNQNFINTNELRLVLLGRTGSGKSAAGNAILGQHKFKLRRDDATGATTQSCVNGTAMVGKKRVTVVDTPDWFWPPENMETHLSSCIDLCAPGPHAFLLCVPVTLPGRSNLHDLSSLKSSFGPDDIQRRTLVLFTHSDKLKDGNVEDYIAAKRPELLELVEKCEDRFHVLKQGRNERNIEELLEKVEQAVKESGGSHYSCQGQGEVGRERMTQLRRGRGGEDAVDRANSATLHSLREEEEVEQEEKNTNTWKTTASSVASVLGTVLKFVGQKVGQGAQQVPKPVAGGAVLGGVLGMYFGGPIGGAVGVTAGSAAAEYGRRKYSKPKTD